MLRETNAPTSHAWNALAALLLPFLLLSACQQAPSAARPTATTASAVRIEGVRASAPSIGRYEKVELTLDLVADYQNPFDPAQIDVQARFTGPSGTTVSVPGFYSQDFESALSGGKETLTARGAPTWKLRFTPTEEGDWSYNVIVRTLAGAATSERASLAVTPSKRHGFVRVDRRDPAYFAFDDGTPYVAIGQNVSWYGQGGSHDYERWFGKMHEHGANFARLWMASWAMGIEWSDTGLGDYTRRLDRAWQLDRVFALAEERDIYLMLSLLNHGAYNTSVNPEWDKNPYNAALGGPCATPQDFATNAQGARALQASAALHCRALGLQPEPAGLGMVERG